MPRIHIVAGPDVDLNAGQLAAAWNRSTFGSELGIAVQQTDEPSQTFGFDVLVEVIVPIALNVGTAALYDGVVHLVKQLSARKQAARPVPDERVVEVDSLPNGDVTITIR